MCIRTSILVALVATGAGAGAARAVDFPIREVDKACDVYARPDLPGFAKRKNECIDVFQGYYNLSRLEWLSVDDENRDACVKMADERSSTPESQRFFYGILHQCLSTIASRLPRTFRY